VARIASKERQEIKTGDIWAVCASLWPIIGLCEWLQLRVATRPREGAVVVSGEWATRVDCGQLYVVQLGCMHYNPQPTRPAFSP
jgi:hypothetical protein